MMSGFTVGPRTFNWMASRLKFTPGSLVTDTNWEYIDTYSGSNDVAWFESKLDLRAFNEEPGKALSLVNVAIQESGPFVGSTTSETDSICGMMIDFISTVKIPAKRLGNLAMDNLGQQLRLPGFLNTAVGALDWDAEENREYNTSQIIYGMWRFMVQNMNMVVGNRVPQLQTFQAGEFGSGEVITAPHAYYYRVAILNSDAHTLEIPPANCSVHAQVVDLPEFVELAQMARLGQR